MGIRKQEFSVKRDSIWERHKEELIVQSGQEARQKPDSSALHYYDIKSIHITLVFMVFIVHHEYSPPLI